MFIDTLMLYKEYQEISGAGRQPMRMILGLLPSVLDDDERVPCILRPCHCNGVEVDNDYDAGTIEAKLKNSYAKNGFVLMYQKKKRNLDDITVMGRMLG